MSHAAGHVEASHEAVARCKCNIRRALWLLRQVFSAGSCQSSVWRFGHTDSGCVVKMRRAIAGRPDAANVRSIQAAGRADELQACPGNKKSVAESSGQTRFRKALPEDRP